MAIPILEVIQDLKDGMVGVPQLLDACDAVRQDLEAMRLDFEQQVALQDESIRPALGPEIEYANRSLSLYQQVLDSLISYAADFDTDRLSEALEQLPAAAGRLALDFHRFREAALAQRGPTTHPGINLLATLVASQADAEALQQAVDQEINRCHDWLDIDSSETYLGAELQGFYAGYLELLQEIPEDRAPWIESLTQLGAHYARLDVDGLRRRYAYGPSELAWVNLLVHTSWLTTQDSVSPELVRDLACEAAVELDQLLMGLAGWETATDWTAEAGQLVVEMQEWLAEILAWLDLRDHETQATISQRGLDLAARYVPLRNKMQDRPDDLTVRCELCGNRVEGSKCATCGAKVHAAALNPEDKLQESRTDQILTMAEMILREAGSLEQFGQMLDDLQRDLVQAKSKDPGPGVGEGQTEFREAYVSSLAAFEEALQELEEFRQTPSQEALDSARQPLRQSVQALTELQQAMMSARSS